MTNASVTDPLPHITPEAPGIGGILKAEPDCFVVEEIPLYEAGGEGEHLYLSLTRDGWATRDIQKALVKGCRIPQGGRREEEGR